MSQNKEVNLIIFGKGNVGCTLIQQIVDEKKNIEQKQSLKINIPIIANSKKAFFDFEGVSQDWENDFSELSVKYTKEDIINYVLEHNLENLIAIDVTASKEIIENYIPLIESGFHIISANKIANTLDLNFYKKLRDTLKENNKYYLYETNVGAALPVIDTIKKLHDTGEKISKIRGVFSGSLSYIFNTFSETDVSFSEVLTEASLLGLTEPDAREDLRGNDVARKLLILARELNIKKELRDVSVESLVPRHLNGNTSLAHFNDRIIELNKPLQKRKLVLSNEEVLRYVGELNVGTETLEVKLISENKKSSLGQLKGADSVIEIYSESYGEQPLVIQGAGAGKEVTARGVFSDILKLSNQLN